MSKKLRTFARRNNSNLDSIEYQVMKSKTNKKNIMKKDEFVEVKIKLVIHTRHQTSSNESYTT